MKSQEFVSFRLAVELRFGPQLVAQTLLTLAVEPLNDEIKDGQLE